MLYSSKGSCPNVPVDVLEGLEAMDECVHH